MAGGHAWSGGCVARGVCMASGGMHGQRGGMHDEDTAGQCAGGTHPTGMHSC